MSSANRVVINFESNPGITKPFRSSPLRSVFARGSIAMLKRRQDRGSP